MEDEWKAGFRTNQQLFEYEVMPLGLTNAPGSFQEMMDRIFNNMEGYIWNLNNILIYCGITEAEHQAIVEKLLHKCVEPGLAVNLLKSEVHSYETIFLAHIINGQEVKMDSFKLETMSKWPIPSKKQQVQRFLAYANYDHQLIVNYSAKLRPLIHLTKDVSFTWGHIQPQSCNKL